MERFVIKSVYDWYDILKSGDLFMINYNDTDGNGHFHEELEYYYKKPGDPMDFVYDSDYYLNGYIPDDETIDYFFCLKTEEICYHPDDNEQIFVVLLKGSTVLKVNLSFVLESERELTVWKY